MFSRLLRLMRFVGRDAVVLYYACRNPGTPLRVKLLAILMALYVMSPIDIFSDALPILGWLDDVTVLAFGIPAVLTMMPPPILHQAYVSAERLLSRWAFWRRSS